MSSEQRQGGGAGQTLMASTVDVSMDAEQLIDQGAIDVTGFVQRRARALLAATACAGLLGLAAAAASLALPSADRMATLDITPTFPGATEGKYPNRAPFSPQDIIASSVVEPVWKAQGLEMALPLPDVCRNLQVRAGGTDLELVRSEYQQKLANSKLTAAERSALEAEFAAAVKSRNSASLTIVLAASGGALSAVQMQALLAAIPAEWARAADVSGARAYDYPIPGGGELRESARRLDGSASAADAVRHAERMKEFADSLAKSVSSLSKLAGSDAVRDARGGSLVDLAQDVSSSRRNVVIPAYIDMLAEGKARDPSGYQSIRATRRKLLEADVDTSRERAKALRDMFDSYLSEPRLTASGSPSNSSRPVDVTANVDGTFIDRVIEQAVKSRDVEYRRELTDRCLAAELDVVDATARMEFERWLDETVDARAASPEAGRPTVERLQSLTDLLAGLSERGQYFMSVLAARNLNSTSAMYRVDMDVTVRSVPYVSLRTIALATVGGWAALVAAIVAAGALADRRRQVP